MITVQCDECYDSVLKRNVGMSVEGRYCDCEKGEWLRDWDNRRMLLDCFTIELEEDELPDSVA